MGRIDGATVAPIGSLDSGSPSSVERRRILKHLQAGDIDGVRRAERIRLFEAVTHFAPSVPPAALLGHLAEIVQSSFDQMTSLERSQCRKAVAHLDEVLNRADCAGLDTRGATA